MNGSLNTVNMNSKKALWLLFKIWSFRDRSLKFDLSFKQLSKRSTLIPRRLSIRQLFQIESVSDSSLKVEVILKRLTKRRQLLHKNLHHFVTVSNKLIHIFKQS